MRFSIFVFYLITNLSLFYLSWDDCRNDLIDSFPDTEWDDEDVDLRYQEELESWIDYYVIPAEESKG